MVKSSDYILFGRRRCHSFIPIRSFLLIIVLTFLNKYTQFSFSISTQHSFIFWDFIVFCRSGGEKFFNNQSILNEYYESYKYNKNNTISIKIWYMKANLPVQIVYRNVLWTVKMRSLFHIKRFEEIFIKR